MYIGICIKIVSQKKFALDRKIAHLIMNHKNYALTQQSTSLEIELHRQWLNGRLIINLFIFFNNAKQMGKTFFAISDSDLYQLRPACTDGMKYLTPASQKLYEKICDKRIDLTRRRQISKKTHGNGASLITPCARQYAASVLRGIGNAGKCAHSSRTHGLHLYPPFAGSYGGW